LANNDFDKEGNGEPGATNTGLIATPLIYIRDLTKIYILGQTRVNALQSVSLAIYPGEFVAVMGPSGSGKSTFMNIVGCLDRPTQGEYWLAGKAVGHLSNDELAEIRSRMIGFVFQNFNLISRASAFRNVTLPMVYAGISREERELRGRMILKLVGLADRMDNRPSQLSGGQQQRVAIARALVNGPMLLLADEPTGNLDSASGEEVLALFARLSRQGSTIILITHEEEVAARAQRVIRISDGKIVLDEPVTAGRRT